ncbi:unnamed protein product, partial [marine sediment metagenome]
EVSKVSENIYMIDDQLYSIPKYGSVYLINEDKKALIDSGPTTSANSVLDGIKAVGVRPEDIDYIIVTHIHLDHSGGVGVLLRDMPQAQVFVHYKGARHLVNPAKLISSMIADQEVDVVTTGTFGPMCSSGAYFNIGHSKPRIKLGGGRVYLNDVPAYAGLAAVDIFIGSNALPDDDPRNRVYPGEFNYGGGHVIEELVAGKDIKLVATAYGTDCYPRRRLETWINIEDLNQAVLFNIRNAYQNYDVAVNLSDKTIYTYMGILKPNLGNANYSTAGQLSPLLNDP